jgi:hypothetical protein
MAHRKETDMDTPDNQRRGTREKERSLRRLLPLMAAVALLIASPRPAAAQVSAHDWVAGEGTHSDLTQYINAESGPSGENPRGFVAIVQDGRLYGYGTVRCLIVQGNTAYVTWVATTSGGTITPGTTVVTEVVDNDASGTSATPDRIRNSFHPFIQSVSSRPGCFIPVLSPVPIVDGDYIVQNT